MKRLLLLAFTVLLVALPLQGQNVDPCLPEDEIVKTHNTNLQGMANAYEKFSTKVEATSDCKEIVATIDSLVESLLIMESPIMIVDACPKSKEYLSKEKHRKIYAKNLERYNTEFQRFDKNMREIVQISDCPPLGKAVKKLKLTLHYVATHDEKYRQAIFDMYDDKN